MRTRVVRPAFWADSKMAELDDETRLYYIGLWCVADDAGYIEWDQPEICAALMPYRGRDEREALAERASAALIRAGRISILSCGRHAYIPTLERHRIAGGTRTTAVFREHDREPKSGQVRTSTAKSGPYSDSDSDSFLKKESKATSARANGADHQPPMNAERAQAIVDDPTSTDQAKAGAAAYLEMARTFGGKPTTRPAGKRPSKLAEIFE